MTNPTPISFNAAKIELADAGDNFTAWTNITGALTQLAASGGDIPHDDTHTGGTTTPAKTFGKPAGRTYTVTIIYDRDPTEAYHHILELKDSMTPVKMRYLPEGDEAGHDIITTEEGLIVSMEDPVGTMGAAESIKIQFEIATGSRDFSVAVT